jgi:hypothetical protein
MVVFLVCLNWGRGGEVSGAKQACRDIHDEPCIFASDQPLIFDAVSIADRVMLFGKSLHYKLDYLTTHYDEGPKCTHGGQKWKNITQNDTPLSFKCVYGPVDDEVKQVVTKTRSVTQQVVGCFHPPADKVADLVGKPVRLAIAQLLGNQTRESIVPSTAMYTGLALPSEAENTTNAAEEMPDQPATNRAKPYFLCACLTMWYRSEFLLEWARYHNLVHGLEKIFVYDNDSDLDQLYDTSRLINSTMPIDHVKWPHQRVQPAYMAHCLLRATPQCTWVSFYDVDEFAMAKQADGRLDTILRTTERKWPKIGGIEVQMVAMVPPQGTPLADLMYTPPLGSGVVRHYTCRNKATNIKTIAKSDTVLPSLYSGVHFMCYKKGYIKKTLRSHHNPMLLHYNTQAWEFMMRKHIRRASPASTMFYGKVSLDEPSEKWAKQAIGACRAPGESAVYDTTLCALTFKALVTADHQCIQTDVRKLLVVGTGGLGSGMDWIDRNLPRRFYELISDGSFDQKEVFVDWKSAIVRPPLSSSADAMVDRRFATVFHHVRDPLKAIAAITTYQADDWEHVRNSSGFDAKRFKNPIIRSLHHWVLWNQLIELISDHTYRVEDVNLDHLCSRANISRACNQTNASTIKTIRTLPRASGAIAISWELLHRLDPGVTRIARIMANRYGYKVPEDGDLPQAME